jgi:hypothetical protein
MLQLARFVGDQGRQTMARAWLAIFLAMAGDCDSALRHGKDALAMALSRGDRRAEIYAQLALADAYSAQPGRMSEARYHAGQALAAAAAQRQVRHEIECDLRQMRICALDGDGSRAREAGTRALSGAHRLGARHLECLARCGLADAICTTATVPPREDAEPAELAAARSEATAALRLAQESGLVEGEWRARELLAAVALLSVPADVQEAEVQLRAAIAILERLRQELLAAELPDTLLEGRQPVAVYERFVRLLSQAGRAEEAERFLDESGWPPLRARIADGAAGGPRE